MQRMWMGGKRMISKIIQKVNKFREDADYRMAIKSVRVCPVNNVTPEQYPDPDD